MKKVLVTWIHVFLFALFVATVSTPVFAATITYDQCPNCGDGGGPALQILIQGLYPNNRAYIGLVNPTFSYNPATQGAIASIDASADRNGTISQSTPFSGSIQAAFTPLIEQDGKYYVASILGPSRTWSNVYSTTSGYVTISGSGLVASNFEQFDFATGTYISGSYPNFAGDTIQFGLFTGIFTSALQVANATNEQDYENMSLTVNDPTFTDATFADLSNYSIVEFVSAPEPATLVLLGFGLIGVLGLRRKCKQ